MENDRLIADNTPLIFAESILEHIFGYPLDSETDSNHTPVDVQVAWA